MTNNSLEFHRQQFPALANKAYFNYGGQGPIPQAALEAIARSYKYVQSAGPFSNAINGWIAQEFSQTRKAIAAELGVADSNIALTENVLVGCNIALWGIDWQPGDRLVVSDCEHPGVIATINEIQRRFGIEIVTCHLLETLNSGDPVAAVVQHLQPQTKLVAISHILWNTGQVLPLAEIVQACKTACPQVKILVDAAQSVGVLPLNLTAIGADFYAFTGHKWWCGPEGIGSLYVSPQALESLHPTFIGWRGLAGNSLNWKASGERFEISTSATPLQAGLREAIAIHHQRGTAAERYQQIKQLSQYLWSGLSKIPGIRCLKTSPPEAGLVSFQIEPDPRHQQLVQFLEGQQILVRLIRDPECVRACVHYFTAPGEIDRLISAVADFNLRK
jgi:L-cysteine/cystine lyase